MLHFPDPGYQGAQIYTYTGDEINTLIGPDSTLTPRFQDSLSRFLTAHPEANEIQIIQYAEVNYGCQVDFFVDGVRFVDRVIPSDWVSVEQLKPIDISYLPRQTPEIVVPPIVGPGSVAGAAGGLATPPNKKKKLKKRE